MHGVRHVSDEHVLHAYSLQAFGRIGNQRRRRTVFCGVSIYHQGSADLIDDAIRHRGVDYFLCGIAGRQFADNYVERVLRRLEPRVVIPGHYDDFFRPLDQPMGFTADVGVARFTDEVRRVSDDFTIRTLRLGETVTGP